MQFHKNFSEKNLESILSELTQKKFEVSIVQDKNPSFKFLLEQNSAFLVQILIAYDLIRC